MEDKRTEETKAMATSTDIMNSDTASANDVNTSTSTHAKNASDTTCCAKGTPNIVLATDFEHKGKASPKSGKSVGIVCGTFAPLHAGHMHVIARSCAECGITIIIVGGFDEDRGAERGMPLRERYKRLRAAFDSRSDVYVAMVDEKRLKSFDEEEG